MDEEKAPGPRVSNVHLATCTLAGDISYPPRRGKRSEGARCRRAHVFSGRG